MVRAILEGRKTQTRRVLKPQPTTFIEGPLVSTRKHPAPYIDAYNGGPVWCWWTSDDRQGDGNFKCPYGVPGDRLVVGEKWRPHWTYELGACVCYADGSLRKPKGLSEEQGHRFMDMIGNYDEHNPSPWRSPIHMPRWASRITLEVTDVRVERVQEISEADAIAEGLTHGNAHQVGKTFWYPGHHEDPRAAYAELWNSINGEGSWDANPWVWVVSFRRIDK